MGDWPKAADQLGLNAWVITPYHELSIGLPALRSAIATTAASAAWPSANRALFVPFRLPRQMTVYQGVVGCGSGSTGNFDVGVYDSAGNKIVSSGATARAASTEVVANMTDTAIGPGLFYMAVAVDGTTNIVQQVPAAVGLTKMLGVLEMGSAYTLPATATYATVSAANIPMMALYFRSE